MTSTPKEDGENIGDLLGSDEACEKLADDLDEFDQDAVQLLEEEDECHSEWNDEWATRRRANMR